MTTLEGHPYGNFLVPKAQTFIIGTFPIGKFTNLDRKSEILPGEIDFFYGGSRNGLWKLIGDVFSVGLSSKEKIISFLQEHRISMADVVIGCGRKNGSALDKDLQDIAWNLDLRDILLKADYPKLLFTSKTAETWFKKRIFPNYLGSSELLLSPSGSANLSIARRPDFKEWKSGNPEGGIYDFKLIYYKRIFLSREER